MYTYMQARLILGGDTSILQDLDRPGHAAIMTEHKRLQRREYQLYNLHYLPRAYADHCQYLLTQATINTIMQLGSAGPTNPTRIKLIGKYPIFPIDN
jgi:hypothetical protein